MNTGVPTLTIGVLLAMAESMTVLALRKPCASLRPAAIAWAHNWSVSSVWTWTPAGGVSTGPRDTLWSLPAEPVLIGRRGADADRLAGQPIEGRDPGRRWWRSSAPACSSTARLKSRTA